LKVVCALPVAFRDLEFPLPCILIVIVQGTCYEGELMIRLKGCLPRGTLGDLCRNVSVFPMLSLRRQNHSGLAVGASDVKWMLNQNRFTVSRSKVAVFYDYVLLPCLASCRVS
jgi:hypothetical protein